MNKLNLNVLKSNYPKKGLFYHEETKFESECIHACREIAAGFHDSGADSLFFICRPKQIMLKTFFARVLKWIKLSLKVEQTKLVDRQAIKLVKFTSALDTEIFTLICRAYDIIPNADIKSWKEFRDQLLDKDLFSDEVLEALHSPKIRDAMRRLVEDYGGFCATIEDSYFISDLIENISTGDLLRAYRKLC